MLQLTPAAANHLHILLSTKAAPAKAAVRIVRGESGEFQISADVPKSDDVGFEYQGRTVLVLDKQTSELLNDRVLDVERSPRGDTLTLKD
jgi:Fe-S cluster assembly iron-binding protein IscA